MTRNNERSGDRKSSPGAPAGQPEHPGPSKQAAEKKSQNKAAVQTQEKASVAQAKIALPAKQGGFPVVALGASAGGVHALQEFFGGLPADTGAAYVVILHLSRDYESNLPAVLGKQTKMPVQSAEDGQPLAPNRVFVIPPNRILSLSDGTLQLAERAKASREFLPIDRFFESLAENLEERAIGVVLSGTGRDGTRGIQAIKAAGGITIAQSEESAEFGEMPRNAIHSGQVDLVLDPAGIARELGELVHHPHLESFRELIGEEALTGFERIQQLLKSTGIDFSQYKQSTVRRRISRRMAIRKIAELQEYAAYLKGHKGELKALREDLLIKVTQFFRDPEAFQALEKKVFPQILKRKQDGEPIRIWVPGCASGEEVYSLAMALTEYLGARDSYLPAQFFGTDVSEEGVEKAREGFYPTAQVEVLSQARLRKFFDPSDGGYRVKKQLRELCVFARQDFVSDPPFSRLDLISCRNVLIYFGPALQQKVFPRFHYALNPGGFLLLGSAETIGQAEQLFAAVDKKNRIYARKNNGRPPVLDAWPQRRPGQPDEREEVRPEAARRDRGEEKNLHREVDRLLLQRLDPAAVLVDGDWNVVQFRGDTRPYLGHHPGRASLNLLRMTRDTLRLDLRDLLQQADKQQAPLTREHLYVADGQERALVLEVSPLSFGQENFFLVRFVPQPLPLAAPETAEGRKALTESALGQENRRLSKELASSQEYLQRAIEEKDEALEDLKAANEEILSSNEELQSINEELETAKEELESSNEELTTVNLELQGRNEELAQALDDLSNLVLSVEIPFVIVNDDLKIRRISANAEETLKITPRDVGRVLTDLNLSFELPDLETTLLGVIHEGRDLELEVHDRRGRWNLLRIRPYRVNSPGEIGGAVLALFEIDRLKRSLEKTEKAFKYSLRIVDTIKDPLLVLAEDLRVKKANPAFYQKFKVSPQETEGRKVYELGAGQWDRPELRRLLGEILPQSAQMDNYPVEFDFPHLGPRSMLLSARRMKATTSPYEAILLGIQDVTEQKLVEDYLRRAKKAAEETSRAKSEFLANISHEIRTPLTVIISALQYLDGTPLAPEQQRCTDLAERSAQSLLDLLDDLLDFSKIEVDKINILTEPFNLWETVGDSAGILRREAENKGLEFQLHIADGVPRIVMGDRKRLRQVLINLVGNALKFTEEGCIDLKVEVAKEGPPTLRFTVRDTGIGIATEDIQRLFQSFTQLDSSSTRKYGGTGLGLAICRGLVERMGGRIWVESDPGKGSTFSFALPLLEVIDEATEAGAVTAEIPSQNSPRRVAAARILLGEDDPFIRELTTRMLKKWGWEVIEAQNGRQVLEQYQVETPDLILMDLQMPELDGLQATRSIREREAGSARRVPIIALTAHARQEDRDLCLEAGMNDVVTKPVDLEKLQSLILRFLEN